MFPLQLVYFIIFISSTLSRHVPRYADLDEEDQHLFRAAYDTPSYDHDEYEESDDLGKLDLVKDGLWALKAKIKELKAFDKALAANVLATKLKLKDLIKGGLILKKHHHVDYDKKKPYYQAPPSYQQYEPAYHAPAPEYHALPQEYAHDPYYGH
ncbi:uncharacterized protein LOC128676773 [Plodia interpunctella]|uniref:uncharacterized protein LOC128676773 n=1 Tax=Plodia interpunctella TaxID=58824 RepID=UPI002367E9FD|nr:uncharacterized protein LOC128676773 [Plodia interpunctella]